MLDFPRIIKIEDRYNKPKVIKVNSIETSVKIIKVETTPNK